MEAKAVAKFIRVSPRKTRIVADIIKGKNVEDALNILRFTPKKSAEILRKVLYSAVSNAEQMPGVDVDSLIVDTVMVNEGPTWKRIQPRAMGRAYRIRKRTSHITIVVKEQ
ncbi:MULTISPECIES: 50S ribosomal protein L22 [unclassified Pseudodesulfovibrio]|jgi:large subunit ribosomal protein L22|uniref:50S ribosomal protein L22 n=1 Tax=unclassified Pseudodesulfovibrio TaxID=2661612 RepID=UPI000FEBB9F5|nr:MULTISPECIES: 50S ribosomal protein L22 [unclassified Pseudodesulfovibrio]MCJ2163059.1 50S ribosomal protein L22 [Pseudodesulfovibrio sp. S3-i]RWU07052.1 50S ribosomal protein L22 [Pseudodesulfovibrio sp. S3]